MSTLDHLRRVGNKNRVAVVYDNSSDCSWQDLVDKLSLRVLRRALCGNLGDTMIPIACRAQFSHLPHRSDLGRCGRADQYWLSTMSPETSIEDLVRTAKVRWRISNETIRISNNIPAWATTKGADGVASSTYRSLRLPDHPSWDDSPSAPNRATISRRLAFPAFTNPDALPVRPKRHVTTSITTMRRRLTIALVQRVARCPCCNQPGDGHRDAQGNGGRAADAAAVGGATRRLSPLQLPRLHSRQLAKAREL